MNMYVWIVSFSLEKIGERGTDWKRGTVFLNKKTWMNFRTHKVKEGVISGGNLYPCSMSMAHGLVGLFRNGAEQVNGRLQY